MIGRARRSSADRLRLGGWRLAGAWITASALTLAGLHASPDPAPDEAVRLELNLPARRLDVMAYGEALRSYTVTVGAPTFPTPLGSFEITRIVWNPWWVPPPSTWAADEKVTPPCPTNPMGRVKLYFKELHFIHGTPDSESLGTATSHGCVRMASEDAIALARFVHGYGASNADEEEIDRLVENPTQTRPVTLDHPIRFDVVYRIAEVRGGRLEVHPDLYGRVGDSLADRLRDALVGAGFAPDEIDPGALDSLVAHAPLPSEPTLTVPLEALTLPAPESTSREVPPRTAQIDRLRRCSYLSAWEPYPAETALFHPAGRCARGAVVLA